MIKITVINVVPNKDNIFTGWNVSYSSMKVANTVIMYLKQAGHTVMTVTE